MARVEAIKNALNNALNKTLDTVLDRATRGVFEGTRGNHGSVKHEPVLVVKHNIEPGVDVVAGIFPYEMRYINTPSRRLSDLLTRQPVLGLRGPDGVKSLVYAEDVRRLSPRLAFSVIRSLIKPASAAA